MSHLNGGVDSTLVKTSPTFRPHSVSSLGPHLQKKTLIYIDTYYLYQLVTSLLDSQSIMKFPDKLALYFVIKLDSKVIDEFSISFKQPERNIWFSALKQTLSKNRPNLVLDSAQYFKERDTNLKNL